MSSKKINQASRREIENEIIEAFVEMVLTQKFADMPKWIDLNLTVSQLRAVFFLAFRGSLTIGELAKLLGMGNPAASILVQQLVQQELAERSEDAKDRRRTLVRLTERGAELMRGRREQREAKFRNWLSQLSDDELAGLRQGLVPLVKLVQADLAAPSPRTEPAGDR
ncbi:MAG: MarR family transcriptional regulator [Chloroflexi bacterium]|nr:MarR family transcriptional regulator [Chloroflexota bacterium]